MSKAYYTKQPAIPQVNLIIFKKIKGREKTFAFSQPLTFSTLIIKQFD